MNVTTQMQADSFEKEHFIDPIETSNITFVGFVDTYTVPSHPVFNIQNTTISSVISELTSLCNNCKLDSGGLQAYFIHPDSDPTATVTLQDDIAVVCKIENWWNSCIPNEITDIQSYISQQEDKMHTSLTTNLPISTIHHNTHKDCLLNGGSQIKEGHGQYQFIAEL